MKKEEKIIEKKNLVNILIILIFICWLLTMSILIKLIIQ